MAQGWKAVDARRYDEAYSLFDKAVEARPGSPDALYGRAYASAKRGDKASARVDYCNALEKTTDPELRVELEAGLRQVGGSCN
jgi:Flp pilus assembly protein TadD